VPWVAPVSRPVCLVCLPLLPFTTPHHDIQLTHPSASRRNAATVMSPGCQPRESSPPHPISHSPQSTEGAAHSSLTWLPTSRALHLTRSPNTLHLVAMVVHSRGSPQSDPPEGMSLRNLCNGCGTDWATISHLCRVGATKRSAMVIRCVFAAIRGCICGQAGRVPRDARLWWQRCASLPRRNRPALR
jgi:hypothetical protein